MRANVDGERAVQRKKLCLLRPKSMDREKPVMALVPCNIICSTSTCMRHSGRGAYVLGNERLDE